MIVYASRTGNVKSIVEKLSLPATEIKEGLLIQCPYILLTYTDKLGDIPDAVRLFLADNHSLCLGVAGSGNSNFGHQNFCGSVDKIHAQFGIPVICKMEMRGFQKDYDTILNHYHTSIGGKHIDNLFTTQQ